MPAVVSFGGGVNSTALLIGMHERGERPDAILFADTKGEMPDTYRHVEAVQEWCGKHDFPEINVVTYYESAHASLEDECHNNETLPSKAFGFSGCSTKWKRQPMDKFLASWHPGILASWHPGILASWHPGILAWERGEKVDRLIGIHAGETRRGKIPDDAKYHYIYPLREWKWGQEECQDAIKRAGLQVPCKSACFFCPARRKPEIIQLAKEHPDLMDRAIAIERQAIATGNLKTVKGLGRNYSWEALLKADNQQQRLFIDCQAPLCDICMDQDEPTVSHVLEVLHDNIAND